MRAGRLRHRVVIQSKTTSQDSYGEPIETWDTSATVWAAVEPVSGKEYWDSQQVQAEVSHKITIRYLSAVTVLMRILWGTRVFEIESVIVPDERKREMILMCTERVT